jgi:magnesium chelatase subunit D
VLLDAPPAVAAVEPARDPLAALRRRRDRAERGAMGRRDRSLVALRRGKHTRHRLLRPGDTDVAVDATLRAAAIRTGRAGGPIEITSADLRRRVREHRVPYDVCFVVDNSYSLHADRLVEHVKGLVYAVLEDALGRRDRVALVAFKPGLPEATVALRPTSSLRLATSRLRDVPLSGRTPLAHALSLARRLLRQEAAKRPNARPVVVVASDALPNVPLRAGADPIADTLAEAHALRRGGMACLVLDASPAGGPAGCGRALAEAGGGIHLALADVAPALFLDTLVRMA